MKRFLLIFLAVILLFTFMDAAKKDTKKEKKDNKSSFFSGMKFRSIGPAFASGRLADIAVNPKNHSEFYVGVACGNIWKTTNNGHTFKPVFENYGSYSIGCLAMDPTNSNVVWAGTGENNHQRALAYGDGIYKTIDGGKSWKNMGLKQSRQIGRIVINPKNPDIVYVAAEGSVWGPGGERGLYKTIDGGKTWKKVLNISNNTGINDIVMDPRDPDLLYASSEQRRRHVHTKIGGGPETAIYKTTDGGANWRKLKSGLPTVDMGGIGLAISPVNPDYVYAIIEAAMKKGGFYRSTDRGESWTKMSSYSCSGQYYNEIFCDPKDVDKVYSAETRTKVTLDGGKTFKKLSTKKRHVDDHALWINPNDTAHLLIGGDGGLYSSYDSGAHWYKFTNLPVTQFYRVGVDNSYPFYYVYGGTQDNNSFGGPSRNTKEEGVESGEWITTNSGDGFWTQIDPKNPNIVYAESQYGGMVRYDKKSGGAKSIQPQPAKGEKTFRWNWNTPLIISPHSNTRIYCTANHVFRSDDRGDSWTVISDDLTAQIDRDKWPVMGKFWSTDAVAKDVSSSQYGIIISFDESPVKENLLYAGTDDGLIQVSENGKDWRKTSTFPGVPQYTYVSDIAASKYDENVVYATFNNMKRDDFKPYVLKSSDKGKNWQSIASNLPKNGSVHSIIQDHVKKELLFVGTEFGVFFSHNEGAQWIQLKAGIPTVAVYDIAIQQRENDLALATFGRGFYILDNYAPLREWSGEIQKKEAHLFTTRDALMYLQPDNKYGQGDPVYRAKNPPYGATFTYFLKEKLYTAQQLRHKKEKELFKKGLPIPNPSWDELRKEKQETPPYLLFTVTNQKGEVMQELRKNASKGVNRITWDLNFYSLFPLRSFKYAPLDKVKEQGYPAMPGKYKVTLSKCVNGVVTKLAESKEFTIKPLNNNTLPAKDRGEMNAFKHKVEKLGGVVRGALKLTSQLTEKLAGIKQTLLVTVGSTSPLFPKIKNIESNLNEILFTLGGHDAKASSEEIPPAQVPIASRFRSLSWSVGFSNSDPGKTALDNYSILNEELPPLLEKLKKIASDDIKALEKELDDQGIPWTAGRIPQIKK
ncbi:MAG: glycosyl hydrolase [bacterium]|nr:glycosyl hydrolase [bacterium]